MKNIILNMIIVINIIGAAIFLYDKEASKWKAWRIRNIVMKSTAYIAALGVLIVVKITKHKVNKFKKTYNVTKYIALIYIIFICGSWIWK